MQSIAIDVGNTGTKFGIFNGYTLVTQGTFQGINDIPEEIVNYTFDNAIVASVAADAAVFKTKLSVSENFIVLSDQTALPVLNQYKTPQTLGADRIAAAVGANYLFTGHNCLVFDAGTCITHDFITAEGAYQGGGIAPGLRMKLKALHTFTERLPLVEQIPDNFLLTGQTTQESILSGVLAGTVAELNGLIGQYSEKAQQLTVILCGGDAGFFESKLKGRIFVIPELVLIGLHRILTYNV
jgi:type III pantothenate kinase